MDARKIHLVIKVCEEITKSMIPLGLKPDFSQLRDGKAAADFSMNVTFGDRPKDTENQMNLLQ